MNTTPIGGRQAAPTARRKHTVRGSRGVRRLNYDMPSPEQARRRILSKPGFFATLSPEAWEYVRNYDGPEIMGPPDGPRR